MDKLKPCPFCGCHLIKRHNHYVAINKNIVDYDYWEHPYNDCVLSERVCEMGSLYEKDIDAWNRRIDNADNQQG